jgi:DnaK suppressor protein
VAKLTSKKTPKRKSNSQPAQTRKAASPKPAAKGLGKPAAKEPAVKKKEQRERTPVRGGEPNPARLDQNVNKSAPPSAATDKFAKNQAGLKTRDLAFFRDLLLAKRRELVGDVHSMEQEALQAGGGSNLSNLPLHMADMGTDNYEQEFTLGLVEKDRTLLREINVALAKIRDGSYGICEGTGKPISRARLEAQPWARYSIEFARQREKGMMGRS